MSSAKLSLLPYITLTQKHKTKQKKKQSLNIWPMLTQHHGPSWAGPDRPLTSSVTNTWPKYCDVFSACIHRSSSALMETDTGPQHSLNSGMCRSVFVLETRCKGCIACQASSPKSLRKQWSLHPLHIWTMYWTCIQHIYIVYTCMPNVQIHYYIMPT